MDGVRKARNVASKAWGDAMNINKPVHDPKDEQKKMPAIPKVHNNRKEA